MIGKILSQLLGSASDDVEGIEGDYELLELEEGEWVIVSNVQENLPLSVPEMDSLENLLIEHPSMSVYQMRPRLDEEEEELGSDEDEEDSPRSEVVMRRISWRLAAWGSPLPCHLHLAAVQRAKALTERKKLTRSALHRQNLARTRFSPADRRYGQFKQPCQRLYNY